jgi:HYR domain
MLLPASPAAASVTLPPGSIPVPSSGTFLYMYSEPGDYIGQGMEQLYTSADTSFTAYLPQGGGAFTASVIQGAYDHWWYVDVDAPSDEPLVIGSYENAERYPFNSNGAAGLSIYGDGRGCNTLTGRFDVNDIQHASTGELLVFDATFEQHCEGGTPALYGRIRIENPPPPPDTTPPTLYLYGDVTVEAPDTTGTNVSFAASATDDRDPNPTVECSPASGSFFPVGTTTVNCTATDQSGNVARGSFLVHVVPPLQFGLAVSNRGSVNTKTGVATISGTLTCSREIFVDVSGTLKQLFAKRVYITGSFYLNVDCKAPSTKWSVGVTGTNGRFGAGDVTATVDASGCELNCHGTSATQAVKLSGK